MGLQQRGDGSCIGDDFFLYYAYYSWRVWKLISSHHDQEQRYSIPAAE